MDVREAQETLGALLLDPAHTHVTELAAACLRAVDAGNLAGLLGDWSQRERYHGIYQQAAAVLAPAPLAVWRVSRVEKHELSALRTTPGAVANDDGWSLYARAVAQALHEERREGFRSYFAEWGGPRRLEVGDPVPVPTRVRVDEIYAEPHLKCCPSPDLLTGPAEFLPGGYRGLPSLRLFEPARDCPADVFLDPSLGESVCPFTGGDGAAGKLRIIVPAPDLTAAFEVDSGTDERGELGFANIRAKDPDGLRDLIVAEVKHGADKAALVIMPELASIPAADETIDRLHANTGIGTLQLLVGGSAWRQAESGSLPTNRARIWPRGRGPHDHDKYAWFRNKKLGTELIARGRPRVTIVVGPRVSYTVLICKDALEPWVPHLLQELRVRLVLIPSCNPTVETFLARAKSLAELSWTTVVVANIPNEPSATPEYGLVVRPASPKQKGLPATSEHLLIAHNHSISFTIDLRMPGRFDLDRTVLRT